VSSVYRECSVDDRECDVDGRADGARYETASFEDSAEKISYRKSGEKEK